MHMMIVATVRNEIECTPIPMEKPFWQKFMRPFPLAGIVAGTVKIKHHTAVLWKAIAFPAELLAYARDDEREERIEATRLLHEQLDVAEFFDDLVTALRMLCSANAPKDTNCAIATAGRSTLMSSTAATRLSSKAPFSSRWCAIACSAVSSPALSSLRRTCSTIAAIHCSVHLHACFPLQ